MKKLIAFFVNIYKWFILVFTREYETTEDKVDKLQLEPKRRYRPRTMPAHNNRGNKRGRYTQHVKIEGGGTRPVYHSVIKN